MVGQLAMPEFRTFFLRLWVWQQQWAVVEASTGAHDELGRRLWSPRQHDRLDG